jgi:hypothetical protein
MGTKKYEKGYGCVGFYFRRFLVEESRDADLRWKIYGLSKVYRRKAYGKDIENYFWNFRWWRRHGKCLGRLWSVSNIYRNFLGFFWKGKRAYSHSRVHLLCVPSIFRV